MNIESDALKERAAVKIQVENQEVDLSARSRLAHDDPLMGMKGPMTRSKTKKMQEPLNQLIQEVHDDTKIIESKKSNESTSVTVLQVENSQSTSLFNFKSKPSRN